MGSQHQIHLKSRWGYNGLNAAVLLMFGIGISVVLASTSRVTIEAAALSKKGLFD